MYKSPMKRIGGTLVASVAVVGSLALASSAMAAKDFSVFAQCPISNPAVNYCVYGNDTSGHVTLGSTEVPIKTPIILQGGIIENEVTEAETFVNATNGEGLSKSPQTVPGGLLGIIAPKGWPKILQEIFNEIINHGSTGVTATTELVAVPTISRSNLINSEGTALSLPVRVHLNNEFLGNNCYIGSSSHPVTLNLTTGTTTPPKGVTPLTGSPGTLKFLDENQIIVLTNNKLVENDFSAPEVTGCGSQFGFLLEPLVNLAVDAKVGLPAKPGVSSAELIGTVETASAESVKKS